MARLSSRPHQAWHSAQNNEELIKSGYFCTDEDDGRGCCGVFCACVHSRAFSVEMREMRWKENVEAKITCR